MNGAGTADQVDRAAPSPGDSTAGVDPLTVTQRLQREGRWKDIEPERDEMMKLARKRFKDKDARQQWVYSELDRMYPPLGNAHSDAHLASGADSVNPSSTGESENTYTSLQTTKLGNGGFSGSDGGPIQGLSSIPEGWPDLPANASLAAEVAWVQANRLWVVEERPGRATLVRLDRAASAAPSRAALGWLETSIRSYAKFVDVAGRVSGGEDDESAVVRRERRSIAELVEIMEEMRLADDADPCPRCGRPR